jgi:hypothetical protein
MWPWVQPTSVGPLAWSQPQHSRLQNVACPPVPQPPPSLGKARDWKRRGISCRRVQSIACGGRASAPVRRAKVRRHIAMRTQPGRLVRAPSKAWPKRFEVQVLRGQPRTAVSSCPNRERRVNRTDCVDEQRQHHQAPAPKGRPIIAPATGVLGKPEKEIRPRKDAHRTMHNAAQTM